MNKVPRCNAIPIKIKIISVNMPVDISFNIYTISWVSTAQGLEAHYLLRKSER